MKKKYNKLIKSLSKLKWVESILLVGSSNTDKIPNDIDLLLISKGSTRDLYNKLVVFLDNKGARLIQKSDDAICFYIEKQKYSIALYNFRRLNIFLNNICDGKYTYGRVASWAIKYWIPEALCSDLLSSKLLYCKDKDRLNSIINKVRVYPSKFRKMLLSGCKSEISAKAALLNKKGIDSLQVNLLKADISAAVVRYLFAHERCYLRGFKGVKHQAAILEKKTQSKLKILANFKFIGTKKWTRSVSEFEE